MKRTRLNPRKLLIASAGVATVNYAFAAGCGDKEGVNYSVIANLMPGPPYVAGTAGGAGPSVANLVAPPPPVGGTGGRGPGPVAGAPLPELPDAAVEADVADAAEPGDTAADGG